LAANGEEGGWRPSLDEDRQDLLGGLRPGAVVEGERNRQRPWVPTGRVEGDRDHAAGQLPAVQDGPGRTRWKRPHRVAGPAAHKLRDCPGHGLESALAAGHRDSVATVEASGCSRRLAVDQHPGG
jgi:hypothetical protein